MSLLRRLFRRKRKSPLLDTIEAVLNAQNEGERMHALQKRGMYSATRAREIEADTELDLRDFFTSQDEK